MQTGWDYYYAKCIDKNILSLAIKIILSAKEFSDKVDLNVKDIISTPLQDGGISLEYINLKKCLTIILRTEYVNSFVILREIDNEITEDYEVEFSKTSLEKEIFMVGSVENIVKMIG